MKSKFSDLVAAKLGDQAKKTKGKATEPPAIDQGGAPIEETETREITIRRAVGKRSKTDTYTQVSAYIPKDTHKKVKAALIDDERDFSELVSDLLAEWLRGRE